MVITSCFPCNWLAFLSVYERIAFFEEGENLSPTLNWANYLPFPIWRRPGQSPLGFKFCPDLKRKTTTHWNGDKAPQTAKNASFVRESDVFPLSSLIIAQTFFEQNNMEARTRPLQISGRHTINLNVFGVHFWIWLAHKKFDTSIHWLFFSILPEITTVF